MCNLNEDVIKALVTKAKAPIILKEFVKDHAICQWPIEKWQTIFDKPVPFRCFRKDFVSEEPCWERKCETKEMTFQQFLEDSPKSPQWMYFDYKYLHQWFTNDSELIKNISWKEFGFPEKGAMDSTLWVGSEGAHTPAHQDTYGFNIVTQLYGKKHWILFPPDTAGLKPTRVPYEESSIYSELNFYCPTELTAFKGLTGGRSIELCAGDALVVPRGWWHFVQNTEAVNIAINMWLPHEKDDATRVSEALIRILIAQVCKDLPENTAKLIVNPNEDDIGDTPLAVLFLQLETMTKTYAETQRKKRRIKRQKTKEETSTEETEATIDVQSILKNFKNKVQEIPQITSNELVNLIESNLNKYTTVSKDDVDGETKSLRLTKAVIDAFSEHNVIELVKQNLLAKLKNYDLFDH